MTQTFQLSSKKTFQVNHGVVCLKGDLTVLQACEKMGIWIPRFCYSESLSIAGNCRMCLVEIEKSAKLMPACAIQIGDQMKIHTQTNLVKKVRESILEFLLINHPLDCPICDQGGECDLQDQAMFYGSDRGRFYDYKRSIQDKNGGPLIKTIMTRCIHCTRCIRFATEIAGVESYGTSGRGKGMEVGTYISNLFSSELSGNVIDLCPVGALTSKPYAFSFRPWELKSIESIDVLDGMGSGIKLDTKGSELMRILPLPSKSDLVNEFSQGAGEWISDKTRFAFDGLQYQRLISPMVAFKNKAELFRVDWKKAFTMVKANSFIHTEYPETVKCQIGPFIDLETISSLKKLMNCLGIPDSNQENHLSYSVDNLDFRSNYLLELGPDVTSGENPSDHESNNVLLIACDPRYEASLLNVRLRRQSLARRTMDKPLNIFSIGQVLDLTYSHKHLGNGIQTLMSLFLGQNRDCHSFLPLHVGQSRTGLSRGSLSSPQKGGGQIILGFSLLRRKDSKPLWQAINNWTRELKNFLVTSRRGIERHFPQRGEGLERWHLPKGALSLDLPKWTGASRETSCDMPSPNILHPYASSAGACDLGFGNHRTLRTTDTWESQSFSQSRVPDRPSPEGRGNRRKSHIRFWIGADPECRPLPARCGKGSDDITIYQGHHGNTGAESANFILPSTSYVEKNASFVNFQGRLQQTQKAIDSSPQARDDWKILCALGSQVVKHAVSGPQSQTLSKKTSILAQTSQSLPLFHLPTEGELDCQSTADALSPLRRRGKIDGRWRLFKVLSHLSSTPLTKWNDYDSLLQNGPFPERGELISRNLVLPEGKGSSNVSLGLSKTWKTNWVPLYDNFYLTDVISKSSITMAKCSAQFISSHYGRPA